MDLIYSFRLIPDGYILVVISNSFNDSYDILLIKKDKNERKYAINYIEQKKVTLEIQ